MQDLNDENFRIMINNIDVVTALLDSEGRILVVNKTASERLGVDHDKAIGQVIFNFFPPDIGISRKARFDDAVRTGRPVHFEDMRDDRTYFNSMFPIHNEAGEVAQVAVHAYDISGYKQDNITLRKKEERLRKLTEASSDIIYSFNNVEKRFEFASSSFEYATGYSLEELEADPTGMIRRITHPDDKELIKSIVSEQKRRGPGARSVTLEYRLVRKDGDIRWVSDVKNFEFTPDGIPYYINGIIRDITYQKQAELNLQQNRDLLQAILDSTDEGILVVDNSGRITHTNKKFAELWKIPEHLLSRKDDNILLQFVLDQLVDPDSFLARVRLLYEVADEALDTITFKDGRCFERYSRPLLQDEAAAGRVWVFRDVTLRKQTERRLDTLLRSVPDAMLYQTGGDVEYISSNVENILGYTSTEVMSDRQFFPGIIHPDDTEGTRDAQKKWRDSGAKNVLELEFRARCKDGSYIWLLDRMAISFQTSDGRNSYIGVMLDITGRKIAEAEREKLISNLKEAISKIKVLSGLIPICSNCKKIRDDKGFWNQLEDYISKHSSAIFSHGLCPTCVRDLYPELYPLEPEEE